jgi:aspartate-semialdehyde dehydrogenase
MSRTAYRIAVVGAATLLGKEIGDEIAESPLATATTILLDTEDESGTLEAIGDEASFIQPLEAAALENLDVAIFADAAMLAQYGRTARNFGVAVVDATGSDGKAPARSPLVGDAAPLNLETTAVRVAHPVATLLATVLTGAAKAGKLRFAAATILQPASEGGRAAVDELQQQTISLLSFQPVPKEKFDAQSAFNLLPALGEAAPQSLADVQKRIAKDLLGLTGDKLPTPLLQVIQAPVFHGFTVSLFLDFAEPVEAEALTRALTSEQVEFAAEDGDAPSNLSSAGQGKLLVQLQAADESNPNSFSLWIAADNLKLTARTAVACALELTRMRPLGKVQ